MSTARERDPQDSLQPSAKRAAALVRMGDLQLLAQVVEFERSTMSLVVPRGTRVAVGDHIHVELTDRALRIDDLVVEAVCDTQRFRRASDAPRFGDGCAADETTGLWLRCAAETPKARALLWSLTSGQETQVLERTPTTEDRRGLPARGHDTEQARLERLQHLRKRTGKPLERLGHTMLVAERLQNNIENLIGGVEVPVGAAGPLFFKGQDAQGSIFLPMATTEGALVASATRGALAMTLSGGVRTRVLSQAMHRVPGFVFANVDQACTFVRWVTDFESEIRAQARQVSRHAQLVSLEPVVLGRTVHVRFVYETGDAAGQNMTTSCTWHACQWILEHLRHLPDLTLERFFVDAGLSTDKKASFGSLVRGRGIRVTAECFLDRATMIRVLKVTPEEFLRNHHTGVAASLQAGVVGYNINIANVIAAVFTACGQDIACVHESSFGILQVEPWEDGIYASMLLPSLIVGTVGGGTHLPQQHEYLELMDCAGGGRVERLAEIIAGYCLALDLSTISAIMSGHFALAHERLGRNRPVSYLQKKDLTPAFFEGMLRAQGLEMARVHETSEIAQSVGSSIVTEQARTRNTNKLVGFSAHRLELELPNQPRSWLDVVLKIKPLDAEVLTVLRTVAAAAGPEIAALAKRHEAVLGFSGCHKRELAIYRQRDPRFIRNTPGVYGMVEDDAREAYVLMLERLSDLTLMDSADDVSRFTSEHLSVIIQGLAELHAIWFGRERELLAESWLGPVPTCDLMVQATEFWSALANHARHEFPAWVKEEDIARWRETIAALPSFWREIEAGPRTLIHNDFSPRNLALRNVEGHFRLCAYDWELATLHLPQRDLVELLAFTLRGPFTRESVVSLVEQHRKALELASGKVIDRASFQRGFVLCLRDFLVNRVAVYTMGHACRDYRFLPRVFRSLMRLLDLFDDEIVVRAARPSSDSFLIPSL